MKKPVQGKLEQKVISGSFCGFLQNDASNRKKSLFEKFAARKIASSSENRVALTPAVEELTTKNRALNENRFGINGIF